GLEQAVRAELSRRIGRGSVTLTLRVSRAAGAEPIVLDGAVLEVTLAALKRIEAAAAEHHMPLAPTSAADILAMRGVQQGNGAEEDTAPLLKALLADLPGVIAAFNEMRAAEGRALDAVLRDQLSAVERLVADAQAAAEARKDRMADTMRANLAKVMDNVDSADPDRVAQELALIAVKSDIREEMDRLEAHVLAARELLSEAGPVGRKLDFLMQEFNREANTLCSKAQSAALTRIGLDLKATIDQMREQVQNVE
ncbi:MAG: YicC/YloC family endoribonuclease, partial [Paracoccaceae bacterium]